VTPPNEAGPGAQGGPEAPVAPQAPTDTAPTPSAPTEQAGAPSSPTGQEAPAAPHSPSGGEAPSTTESPHESPNGGEAPNSDVLGKSETSPGSPNATHQAPETTTTTTAPTSQEVGAANNQLPFTGMEAAGPMSIGVLLVAIGTVLRYRLQRRARTALADTQ
jgi:hypothetical protein